MTNGFDDYYRTLQVDPAADPEVIEAAYRALARKYHPDRNPAPSAQAEMARLNHAFEVLRSPPSRRAFDADRSRALTYAPAPAPVYHHEPRRAPATAAASTSGAAEAGRSVSLLLIFPLFLLAGAALVLLILFGPLGDVDIDRTSGSSPGDTPATRLARTAEPSASPTATPQPSMKALRNSLLRSRGDTSVDEITGDVTGDGVAELLILVHPNSCNRPCVERSIIVINRDNRYWVISNVENAVLQNISLADPGFEIFQALKLPDEELCCPTTGRATFYRWTGEEFGVSGVYFEPIGANDLSVEDTVRRFYESVGLRNGLLRSYAMTSRAYQDRHPFETWAAGFSTTTGVSVESVEQQAADTVAINVVATDTAASKPKRFKGTWRLVETRFGWRLDEGAIEPQP